MIVTAVSDNSSSGHSNSSGDRYNSKQTLASKKEWRGGEVKK